MKTAAIAASIPYISQKKFAPGKRAICFSNSPRCIVIIAYANHPAALLTFQARLVNSPRLPASQYRGRPSHQLGHRQRRKPKPASPTMRIDAGMDTGDMLLQQEIDIARKKPLPNSPPAWPKPAHR